MNSKFIKPISVEDFTKKIAVNKNDNSIDYMEYFKPFIDKIDSFAIGPYFWFVPSNLTMGMVATSENIGQLTPYSHYSDADWRNISLNNLANMVHPDYRNYVLSAIQIAFETIEKSENREFMKFNIYGRFMNGEKQYRWVLIQFPAFYITERVESALILITDLSHLGNIKSPLLTISDYRNKSYHYFSVIMDNRNMISMNLPAITKRERDIIGLMAKALKTPEIARELFISYSTVENHRKNLRVKTNTKTSSELMSYVIQNNLI
ncbi:LuxR C-terminal-related transcriptional regulator [Flavobacterium sp.]|uniref:LuxR C-terminal-related transcriptional regulator n=1 Tax=Flavobacterium sp. TaxID=239 RepID=UPI00326396A6